MVPELLVLALLCGLALRGRIACLLDAKVRDIWLIGIVLVMMLGARVLRHNNIIEFPSPFFAVERVSELLLVAAFALRNIRIPGAVFFLAGLLLNVLALSVNGGAMPVSYEAILAVWGKAATAHYLKVYPYAKEMFIGPDTNLVWLCDVIAARKPFFILPAVYSVGDLISSLGCMIGIVFIMRTPTSSEQKTASEEP